MDVNEYPACLRVKKNSESQRILDNIYELAERTQSPISLRIKGVKFVVYKVYAQGDVEYKLGMSGKSDISQEQSENFLLLLLGMEEK